MLSLLLAAAMVGSFFMPWVQIFGESLGPAIVFEQDVDWSALPWQGYAFFGSFVAAGMAIVMLLLRQGAGFWMLLAGGLPVGMVAQGAMQAQAQVRELPGPLRQMVDLNDLEGAMQLASEVVQPGLYIYAVAAVLLVLTGLAALVRGR